MPQLPMIPGWDGIHPLLIHFPLTLFFLAPVFVLFAGFAKTTTRQTFLISALTVMLLGVASTYAAFEVGQTAAATVTPTGEVQTVVERHQELASLARSSLTVATLLFGLTLLICTWFHLQMRELTGVLPVGLGSFLCTRIVLADQHRVPGRETGPRIWCGQCCESLIFTTGYGPHLPSSRVVPDG